MSPGSVAVAGVVGGDCLHSVHCQSCAPNSGYCLSSPVGEEGTIKLFVLPMIRSVKVTLIYEIYTCSLVPETLLVWLIETRC